MMINDITSQVGANKRRTRKGRGHSAGKGKTCGRGHKGTQSRSGGRIRPLTEGGQMPLFRRLPKRGFSNEQFRRVNEVVNVGDLNRRFADGETVTPETLLSARLIRTNERVRILGTGALERKLTVEAHSFSAKAKELIEKAGGTAKVIEVTTPAEKAAAKRMSKKPNKATAKPKAKPAPAAEAKPAPAEMPAAPDKQAPADDAS